MNSVLIGKTQSQSEQTILLKMANRHGLVAGATGTGKTVTLQKLAEGFASAGISVVAADIKGDLSGLSKPGNLTGKIAERWKELNLGDYTPRKNEVVFWDVFGQSGIPLKTTVSELGPLLLSRMLDLNETQSAVMHSIFKIADDEKLALLDLKDLTSLINWIGENLTDLTSKYGAIAKQSLGAIQRSLQTIESEGAGKFLGEPAFDLSDFLQRAPNGSGVIHILDATKLMHTPRLYGIVLLSILSELFEELPEVGDLEKPKLAFFFDEAHLLFEDAPKILIERIEQLVRLIRSKGVGVYFVTQNPLDIPESVLGQLGNRVQHALRAFTPKDEKAVKSAARTFRQNPAFKTESAITTLGVGEALVSTLDEGGSPTIVEIVKIAPPSSFLGPISDSDRELIKQSSPLNAKYGKEIDRESAYELLQKRAESKASEAPSEVTKVGISFGKSVFKSIFRNLANQVGREILRGILGGVKRR